MGKSLKDSQTDYILAKSQLEALEAGQGLDAEIMKTRRLLEKAENRLIHHYMNCFPLRKARMLKRAIEKDPDFRQKIIARALLLK